MTIYAEERELEAIPVSERHKCVACEKVASWCVEQLSDSSRVSMCGWCVMYSGQAAWGHAYRDELVHVGRACRDDGGTNVPELDERSRLDPVNAERYLMGVVFTSRALRNKLRRFHVLNQRAEE
jgi:hypothetical protein